MKNVHLIIPNDYRCFRNQLSYSLNSGVFFIEIHEWSLDFLMRVKTYQYHNIKEEKLWEQSVINNILNEKDELEHYVVVPSNWFNSFYGIFISHLMGPNKIQNKENTIKDIKINPKRYSKTNEELRKEVLEYYEKPKDEQINKKNYVQKLKESTYSKTNEEFRKEVLKYYKKPKEEQKLKSKNY